MAIPVYVEAGSKRVFACAFDWPGWCRVGRTEEAALDALAAYAPRYAVVAKAARLPFPAHAREAFRVVERVRGSASTDFGVPGEVTAADRVPLTRDQAARQAALVGAAWMVLDRAVAGAPAELRKGPRGGGRDRDAIAAHVREAESAYARKLGLRLPWPPAPGAPAAARAALLEALAAAASVRAVPEKGWPARYAARRIAWHALDHAWEIQDRSATA